MNKNNKEESEKWNVNLDAVMPPRSLPPSSHSFQWRCVALRTFSSWIFTEKSQINFLSHDNILDPTNIIFFSIPTHLLKRYSEKLTVIGKLNQHWITWNSIATYKAALKEIHRAPASTLALTLIHKYQPRDVKHSN